MNVPGAHYMSFNIGIFDPAKAPCDPEHFAGWWQQQTEYQEGHRYDDPKVTTPSLREWFLEMIKIFPAMNGPYAPRDELPDESATTDYSIGNAFIFTGFSGSKSEEAWSEAFRLAEKHQLGLVEVFAENVWLPNKEGKLEIAFSTI
jgi:hypothetical protein